MEKRPKVAVNIFVLRDGQILLGKRKGIGDGYWALPGGHVEFMERLSDAAKRELEEETGLKAVLSLAHVINDPRIEDNTHYVHFDFMTESFSGEPELREPEKCYEWKWFNLKELPENIFIGHRSTFSAFFSKTFFVD